MVNYAVEDSTNGVQTTEGSEREYITSPTGKAIVDDRTLPYISKSRVKEWVKCPRSFYFSYVVDKETEETMPMLRGTRIHLTFEKFYENAQAHFEATGDIHDDLTRYLPEGGLWLDWIDPYIVNFIEFEERRLEYTREHTNDVSVWLPVSVEEEGNLDDPPVEDSPPWFGYSDIIYHEESFPDTESTEGVVVVDVKTGKTPDQRYRREGILLELAFYEVLFREKYEVTHVAGVYPRFGDVITASPDPEIEQFICDSVEDMLEAMETYQFPIDEQPLCSWSQYEEGENTRCDFFEHCCSKWSQTNGPGPNFYDENKNPLPEE